MALGGRQSALTHLVGDCGAYCDRVHCSPHALSFWDLVNPFVNSLPESTTGPVHASRSRAPRSTDFRDIYQATTGRPAHWVGLALFSRDWEGRARVVLDMAKADLRPPRRPTFDRAIS